MFTFPAGYPEAEFVLDGDQSPDYLVGWILSNGSSYHHLVVEIKNHGAVTWQEFIKDQACYQCDAANNQYAKRFL